MGVNRECPFFAPTYFTSIKYAFNWTASVTCKDNFKNTSDIALLRCYNGSWKIINSSISTYNNTNGKFFVLELNFTTTIIMYTSRTLSILNAYGISQKYLLQKRPPCEIK